MAQYAEKAQSSRNLAVDRRGAVAIEYAMIGALMALLAIGGTTAFGTAVVSLWTAAETDLGTAMELPE